MDKHTEEIKEYMSSLNWLDPVVSCKDLSPNPQPETFCRVQHCESLFAVSTKGEWMRMTVEPCPKTCPYLPLVTQLAWR